MPRNRDDDFDADIADYGTRLARANAGPRPCLDVPAGLKFYKAPKTGAFTIDILHFRIPERINKFHEQCRYAPAGKLYPEQTFYVHRVGVNNDSLTCPAMTFGTPCPVCKDAAQYRNRPDKEARQAASDLRASEQQIFLVFDHDQKDAGLQLWHISKFCFGKQLDAYIGSVRPSLRDKVKAYFHPTRGMSIRAFATEESMDGGKKYAKYGINEIFDRERPLPDAVIHHNYCLTDMVRVLEYKQLEAIYKGEAVEDNADDREITDGEPAQESRREEVRGEPRTQVRRDESRPEPRGKPEEYRLAADENDEVSPTDAKAPCATRDAVRFEYREEVFEGIVVKVDAGRKTVHVKCDDRDQPRIIDFSDIVKVLKRDTVFDGNSERAEKPVEKEKPAPAKSATRDDEWDDADPNESRVPTKTAGKAKAAAKDDDEDPPAAPPKKKRGG